MDEENKILNTENSVEISNLDVIVRENVSENYIGNELNENTQNVEEILPKKNKLKKVLFIILWILGVLFLIRLAFVFLFIKWISNFVEQMSSTNISVDQKDWLYKFNGRGNHNGVAYYMLTPVNANKIIVWDDVFKASYDDSLQNTITLSIEDYDWIDGIYNFKSYIYLDLNFSSWKIINWSIIDGKTEKNLWQLSADELNQLYNFEAKYPIKEIEKENLFKLSELDENVIYKYVLTPKDESSPWIINDLDCNVVVYKKRNYLGSSFSTSEYEPKIYFVNDTDYWWFRSSSYDEIIYMFYQRATKEDIIDVLKPLYLSQYDHWKEIDIRNEDYLYNDTDETLKLELIDETFWEKETKDKKALKPWEVYKKGSSIDYVIIK